MFKILYAGKTGRRPPVRKDRPELPGTGLHPKWQKTQKTCTAQLPERIEAEMTKIEKTSLEICRDQSKLKIAFVPALPQRFEAESEKSPNLAGSKWENVQKCF